MPSTTCCGLHPGAPGSPRRWRRTSCATPSGNLANAGGRLDEIAELLGHRSMASSQVYLHPDPARLRPAVEAVPTPRRGEGADR